MSDIWWNKIEDFLRKGFQFDEIFGIGEDELEVVTASINGIFYTELNKELEKYLKNYKSELNDIRLNPPSEILNKELININQSLNEFNSFYKINHPESKYKYKEIQVNKYGIKYYDSSGTILGKIKTGKLYNGKFKNGQIKDGNFIEFRMEVPWQEPRENYLKVQSLIIIKKFIQDLIQLNKAKIVEIRPTVVASSHSSTEHNTLNDPAVANSVEIQRAQNPPPKKTKTISNSFKYDLANSSNLKRCFDALVEGKFIVPTGKNYFTRVFWQVFTNKLIRTKINWIGDKKALYKFIIKSKSVLGTKQYWKITSKCFLLNGKDIAEVWIRSNTDAYISLTVLNTCTNTSRTLNATIDVY